MNKNNLGVLITISGVILLSIELYLLEFFLLLDNSANAGWRNSAWDYLADSNIGIALFLSFCIIISGIILLIKNKIKK